MTDDKDWFAPKRYGYGAGVPISWQGWAVNLGFAAAVCGAAFLFRDRPLPMFAAIVPFLIAFIVITARTTRGGWRWRWGKED